MRVCARVRTYVPDMTLQNPICKNLTASDKKYYT